MSDLLDPDLEDVAVGEKLGRSTREADSFGGARGDDVAWEQRHSLRKLGDDARDGKDHLARVAVLLFDAIAMKGKRERLRVAHLIGSDDPGPDRTGRIQTLALEPLTVLALKVSGGDVVESGVAEYDMERLVLRDVLALGPDDDGELRFKIVF